MSIPFISVIIAVKNGQNTLERCIESVFNCVYGNFEIICVDDGSSDDTCNILKSYSGRLKVLTHPVSTGPSISRNEAAAIASGEFLAFTDADCVVDKDWLSELVRCFNSSDIVSGGGAQKVPGDESVFGKQAALFMESVGFATGYLGHRGSALSSVDHNPSCNVMYRKDVFLRSGGFLGKLWPGEDVELDYRLKKEGYRLVFNPLAVVYHYRPSTRERFSRMMFRYGWAQGVLVRKYGFFRPVQFFFLLSCVSAAILAWLLICNWRIAILVLSGLLLSVWFYFLVYVRVLSESFYFVLLSFNLVFYWNAGFLRALSQPEAELP